MAARRARRESPTLFRVAVMARALLFAPPMRKNILAPLALAIASASTGACGSNPDDSGAADEALAPAPVVAMSITQLTPATIYENQTFVADISIRNLKNVAVTGMLSGAFQGKALAGGRTLTIAPNATVHVQLRSTVAAQSGPGTVSAGLVVPCPSVKPCLRVVLGGASRDVTVSTTGPILQSDDVPSPSLPWVNGSVCGDTTKNYGIDPAVPYEWADTPGGLDVPLLGTLVNTIPDSGNDLPWSHPFGNDYWYNVVPDAPYGVLANDVSTFGKADCSPNGLANNKGDGDVCEAWGIQQSRGQTPTWILHTEIEGRLIPASYRPLANDRVYMRGRRIVDCGHQNYNTEMHPPTLVTRAYVDPGSLAVRSSIIAMPYRTNQLYKPAGQPFNQMAVGELLATAAGIGGPLNLLADVDKVPFPDRVVARYKIALPTINGRTSTRVRYHFSVRPGIHVDPPVPLPNDPYHAVVTVTMDPATYVPPADPACHLRAWSDEDVDKAAGWSTGSTRSMINAIGGPALALLGIVNPIGVIVTLNAGIIVEDCSVPGPAPLAPWSFYEPVSAGRGDYARGDVERAAGARARAGPERRFDVDRVRARRTRRRVLFSRPRRGVETAVGDVERCRRAARDRRAGERGDRTRGPGDHGHSLVISPSQTPDSQRRTTPLQQVPGEYLQLPPSAIVHTVPRFGRASGQSGPGLKHAHCVPEPPGPAPHALHMQSRPASGYSQRAKSVAHAPPSMSLGHAAMTGHAPVP